MLIINMTQVARISKDHLKLETNFEEQQSNFIK